MWNWVRKCNLITVKVKWSNFREGKVRGKTVNERRDVAENREGIIT